MDGRPVLDSRYETAPINSAVKGAAAVAAHLESVYPGTRFSGPNQRAGVTVFELSPGNWCVVINYHDARALPPPIMATLQAAIEGTP